jgi:hypothetical protein
MKKSTEKTAKTTSSELTAPAVQIPEEVIATETSEEVEIRSEEIPEPIQEIPVNTEPKKNGVAAQPSNILVNRIYRLKREIEEKERKIAKDRNTLSKWQNEDAERLKTINEKFDTDKVNKIIEYRETGCLQGKIILIEYYQKQIEKLTSEKEEQEITGNHGDFSDLYKEYLQTRTEKYNKQLASLQKNYVNWANQKRDIIIPNLEEAIVTLKEELQKAEEEALTYQNV